MKQITFYLLTKTKEYIPEKLLGDVMNAIYRAGMFLRFENVNWQNHFEEQPYTVIELIEDWKETQDTKIAAFIVNECAQVMDQRRDAEEERYCIGKLEIEVGDEEFAFRFLSEYLNLCSDHIIWEPELDQYYQWKDFRRWNRSYDPDWCYKSTGKKQMVGKISKVKDKTIYQNLAGSEVVWFDPRLKQQNYRYQTAINSADRVQKLVCQIADLIKKKKNVQLGQKIQFTSRKETIYLDVVTEDEIIAVFSSLRAITDIEWFDRFTDSTDERYLNAEQKQVILYFAKFSEVCSNDQAKLKELQTKGFQIVSSLEELEEVL